MLISRILIPFLLLIHSLQPINLSAVDNSSAVIDNEDYLPLFTPSLKERKTLKLRLSNGLEAFLISDPKTDQSGAAMVVKAGSWSDPPEHLGIAHFLEHMLFLGTKKYPEESSYSRFISEHGGQSNAFTTHSFTDYMFSIQNPGFEEALDRFSEFFKEPLFSASGTSRELNAIDQEYALRLENDIWRLIYLDKDLSNPLHPYHQFHIGNQESLSQTSRDTLIQWYREHYSANLMRLVVYSSLPIDKLRTMIEADFKDVPNYDIKQFIPPQPIYLEDTSPKMVYIEPVQQVRALTLFWEIPSHILEMKESQPAAVLCYVFGHEGKESLLAELKRENLADQVECGLQPLGPSHAQFALRINLTDEGVEEVNTVIERCFQTIQFLKEKEIPRSIFDEFQQIAKIRYQYQERENVFEYVKNLSVAMVDENLSSFPEKSMIVQKYDPSSVQALLTLLTPSKARYYLEAPSSLTGVSSDQKEKFLGASYAMRPIPRDTLLEWEKVKPHPTIGFPQENPFVTKHLYLFEADSSNPQKNFSIPSPEVIIDNEFGKIYFFPDTWYKVPQISWRFYIQTDAVDMGNSMKMVLADLYVKKVLDDLNEVIYQAKLADLSCEISPSDFGFELTINGFNDNAELLLGEILRILKNNTISDTAFNRYKEALRREYKSFSKETPLTQAFEYFNNIIYKKYVTQKQKAITLNRINQAKFQEYLDSLFEQVFIEGILYGNMTRGQAETVSNALLSTLASNVSGKLVLRKPEVVLLSNGQGPIYWEIASKIQGNAVILAVQGPPFNFIERASQQVLMQGMQESFFKTLRTKQQTGYMVGSDAKEYQKELFNVFAIQSNSHAVRDLLSRFELFIESYTRNLKEEISEERFQNIRRALLEKIEQPPKNVKEMGTLLYTIAIQYQGDFDWMTQRIGGFKALTYSAFVENSLDWMGRSNKKRIAVLLRGVIPKENSLNYRPLGSLLNFRKISKYTRGSLEGEEGDVGINANITPKKPQKQSVLTETSDG